MGWALNEEYQNLIPSLTSNVSLTNQRCTTQVPLIALITGSRLNKGK